MTPQRYKQIQEVFQRVAESPKPQQQDALNRECANDPDLRSQVQKLLPYIAKTTENLLDLTVHPNDRNPATLPTHIGPYEIISRIGIGGMGIVYEAKQKNPSRSVALKVLASRNDDPYYIKLFKREVRALARLDHAGIARIYDAGRTNEGQYYFAMELVRGNTLTDYVKNNVLPDANRLKLFQTICHAINSAHQRGVVHLDLKPSNILIDENGSPRILDFGLARIAEVDATTVTIFRDTKHLHGTLPYMSPEQVRGDPNNIDVRSDIYSLGVILFELMTSALPIEPKGRSWHTLLKAISEQPPRTPREIRPNLPTDVEVIIQKSLEKEPDARYQSALSLAEDIHRYSSGRPILARPQTAFQYFQKWVGRHKIAAAIAATFLISITSVAVWMSALYARASAAEQLAEVRLMATTAAQIEAENKAELHARERDKAERAASFLKEMITLTDPYFGVRGETPVWRLLDKASQRAGKELKDFPQLEADLRRTIGVSYESLELADKADAELRRAIEILRTLGPQHLADLASTLDSLGLARCKHAEFYPTAPDAAQEAVDIRTRLLGPNHPDTLDAQLNLARAHNYAKNFDIAEKMCARVLEAFREYSPEDDLRIAAALTISGDTAHHRGFFEKGSAYYKEAASIFERHKEDMPEEYTIALRNVAWQSAQAGDYQLAENLATEGILIARELLGEKHTIVARFLNSLGHFRLMLDRPIEAAKNLNEAMEIYLTWFPENSSNIRDTRGLIGGACWASGNYKEAERIFRELVELTQESNIEPYPDHRLHTLAVVLRDSEQFDEAESLLIGINKRSRILFGENHPYVANGDINLARLLYLKGEYQRAEPLARGAMKLRKNHLSNNHPDYAETCMVLGLILTAQENAAAGEPLLREALAIRKELWGETHSLVAESRSALAECLIEKQQYTEAETLLLAARTVLAQHLLPQHKYRRLTRQRLAKLYEKTKRPDLVAQYQPAQEIARIEETQATGPHEKLAPQEIRGQIHRSLGNPKTTLTNINDKHRPISKGRPSANAKRLTPIPPTSPR